MADNSRIEDLRKRYHENPRRFFAPLANEYRKSGLLDRALLLCQKHVAEQPENMNGLVVFGQTLFELGHHDAAREPFEQALKLDPENLIALRHLGDIARQVGDVPAAKGWYEKVLELDRRNDEVLDLLAQLAGGSADESESPSARPSAAASGLISVAPTVSVSGAEDIGMIDLGDAPAPAAAEPPAPTLPAGKGATVVINAQALADRDRREAEGGAITQPVPAVSAAAAPVQEDAPPAAEEAPAPRPSKRASLLDIDFDFSEMPEEAASTSVPTAPALDVETAEQGLADIDLLDSAASDTLIVETTGDVAPLGLEPTIAEPLDAPAPELPAGDLELADFSAEVSPLAGLEATEFSSEQVAPMAELESDSISMSLPSVAPLDGLDRPDLGTADVAPVEGIADVGFTDVAPVEELVLDTPADEPPTDSLADLPLLEDPSASATEPASADESPSARPKPRMTKADLASLPLLADFGLDDDPAPPAEPAAPVQPSPRASKATPTFVTETMAALYVQQGLLPEAIGVYRQLVAASPTDASLAAKLAELERMHAQESSAPAPAPASTGAESAAEEMPEFEAPTDLPEPEPAPANAAMDDVSFGEIALKGQGTATPILTPVVASGPSAREFFGGFARRAAVAASLAAAAATVPPVAAAAAAVAEPVAEPAAEADADSEPPTVASVSVSPWPLDALFGAPGEVRDLHAAETLAGIGTFEGPDGYTGLGEILATDASAKRQVPRASETLKFDQFFQKPGTAAPAESEPAAAAPGDDDLDQFQDWLKGLKT